MSKQITVDPELCALALAVFLGIPLDDLSFGYGDNAFVVRPHKVRYDKPFEYYQQMAKEMHELLEQAHCDAPTWQELVELIKTTTEVKTVPYGNELNAYYRALETHMQQFDLHWFVLDKERHPEEIYYYTNGFYHLMASGDSRDEWHIRAVRAAFNGETIVDDRPWSDTNNGEYLVYTEEEAKKGHEEDLKQYLEDVVLPEIPVQYRNYFDAEAWMEDALNESDRGSDLAGYDGEEHEIDISGGDEYLKAVQILTEWAVAHNDLLNFGGNGVVQTEEEIRALEPDDLIDAINEAYDCDPRDAEALLIFRTN